MFEGTLEQGELLPTLRWISALRQGGLLSVQGEPDLVSVTFDGGAIVAADAMNRPAEEMLGEVLARRGLLDPAAFAAAVEPFMGTGRLASEVLAERGLVSREVLLEAVREQTYSQVLRLLRWDSGNFNWTPKVESPFEVGMRPISVAELLLRAADDLGVEGPLRGRPPGLDEVFRAEAVSARTVQTIRSESDWQPGGGEVLWLTPAEDRLLELLRERPSSGARLAAETGLDAVEVRYALHELRRASLVLPVDGSAAVSLAGAGDSGGEAGEEVALPGLEDSGEDWSALPLIEPSIGEHEGVRFTEEPLRAEPAFVEPGPTPSYREPVESWTPGFEASGDAQEYEREPFERSRRPLRRGAALQRAATWLSRGLAVVLGLVVLGLLLLPGERSSLLFPFPWQTDARAAFERSQVTALYDKIDRALRTYYLLYGRYPEELGILVDLELLRSRELSDPRGRWLQYAAADDGYTLQPVESGPPGGGSEVRAELLSDFFLNPTFVELPEPSPNPVLLLD